MRNLAPSILFASLTALVGSTAFATPDSSSTDKVTGSPTVEANTTDPQGTSYSDKSNTSPGTNAHMDGTTSERSSVVMNEHDKAKAAKARKHKAQMARDRDLDTTDRLPLDSADSAAVNSTTGTSPGR